MIETVTPDTDEIVDVGTGDGLEAKVVVFNCDCHTYQQVIELFCRIIPGMSSSGRLSWLGGSTMKVKPRSMRGTGKARNQSAHDWLEED